MNLEIPEKVRDLGRVDGLIHAQPGLGQLPALGQVKKIRFYTTGVVTFP
jgi:hypothetical protein